MMGTSNVVILYVSGVCVSSEREVCLSRERAYLGSYCM